MNRATISTLLLLLFVTTNLFSQSRRGVSVDTLSGLFLVEASLGFARGYEPHCNDMLYHWGSIIYIGNDTINTDSIYGDVLVGLLRYGDSGVWSKLLPMYSRDSVPDYDSLVIKLNDLLRGYHCPMIYYGKNCYHPLYFALVKASLCVINIGEISYHKDTLIYFKNGEPQYEERPINFYILKSILSFGCP